MLRKHLVKAKGHRTPRQKLQARRTKMSRIGKATPFTRRMTAALSPMEKRQLGMEE